MTVKTKASGKTSTTTELEKREQQRHAEARHQLEQGTNNC